MVPISVAFGIRPSKMAAIRTACIYQAIHDSNVKSVLRSVAFIGHEKVEGEVVLGQATVHDVDELILGF